MKTSALRLLFGGRLFFYFWLCWVFAAAWSFPWLCEESTGYSLVVVYGLLIAVASLMEGHGLSGVQASGVEALGLCMQAQ